MTPLQIRRVFCGSRSPRFIGIRGLIFARCSMFNQTICSHRLGPIRSAGQFNLNIPNPVLTLSERFKQSDNARQTNAAKVRMRPLVRRFQVGTLPPIKVR
jgi:hypothetical protein